MDDDRQLLEAAARAAGVDAWWSEIHSTMFLADKYDGGTDYQAEAEWNPLTDDGDALRLAVKLQLNELWFDRSATRRAIVRAAAALGTGAQEKS